ncbi:hypothetical protein HC081234_12490 [Helicobacter cinaedi]|nr:hypothetical protein HC081234_12490 [Helicobacter cinaedi]
MKNTLAFEIFLSTLRVTNRDLGFFCRLAEVSSK